MLNAYNSKLTFESKVQSLRNEVNNLYKAETILRAELISIPISPKLMDLIDKTLSINRSLLDRCFDLIDNNGKVSKDRQSFISDLQDYGSLKSAIQVLSKQCEKVKKEVTSLEKQRRYLSKYNQIIRGTLRISESRNIPPGALEGDSINTPEDELDIR